MATFNISNCKFIKTVDNPKQYYLSIIRKYVGKISDPSMLEDDVKFFINRLVELLKGDSIDDPKVLHKIAFFTFDRVWYEVCEDTTRTPNRSLALERDLLIDNEKHFRKGDSFYSRARDYFRNILYSAAALLTSQNEIGKYAVVDLDAVSEFLHRELNKYYNEVEKINPNLLTSGFPTEALHNTVKNAFKDIDKEFRKVIYNINTTPQTWTF
ncbi:MAG: hypothetical protein IJ458_00285 [Clostridia bacterium]|nr:hypothetical protein [Clostridia bacterium]